MNKLFLIVATALAFVTALILSRNHTIPQVASDKPEPTEALVGGDKDEHGCIGSAGYSWCDKKQKCLRIWEEQCGSDKEEITKVTEEFYRNYEDCMKNPPAEAEGKVGQFCQENTGWTTSSFAANLEKGGTAKAGADPIVCAQDFPESIKPAGVAEVNGSNATAFAEEKFGSRTVRPQLLLKKEGNIWKINNVICPKP